MKLKDKIKGTKKIKDFSFLRFFHPEKSPHTQFNPITRKYDYIVKHMKIPQGRLVWNSNHGNTYIKAKHGILNN